MPCKDRHHCIYQKQVRRLEELQNLPRITHSPTPYDAACLSAMWCIPQGHLLASIDTPTHAIYGRQWFHNEAAVARPFLESPPRKVSCLFQQKNERKTIRKHRFLSYFFINVPCIYDLCHAEDDPPILLPRSFIMHSRARRQCTGTLKCTSVLRILISFANYVIRN